LNDILWGISNALVFYIMAALVGFTSFYGLFFKWWLRPAGVAVFMFMASLLGVIALIFIGIYVDPQRGFFEAPIDVLPWRPALRVVVYLSVAGSVTYLLAVAIRRWLHTTPIILDVDPRTRPPRKR
jgi:hypothetical protein